VSGYQSLPLNGFGRGINLRDKPDAVDPAEAIEALNVLFTDRGAIEQRTGYDNLTSPALTNRVASLEAFYKTSGTKQLLAGCGTRLEALSAAGAVVDSETGLTNAVWDFARFGKPNAEVAYAGNGTDTLRKWDGAEWTAPTATVDGVALKAMPKAGALCVQPFDNRLVCGAFSGSSGGPNGLESSPSHVYWSEPGNPEGYEALAYEQFTPGDGERVMAVVAFREFVFVFKETKFFVVSDSVSDAEANPEFIYRPVETGVGLVSSRAICVHPTGVYFMSRQGVYRTTGQEPELVSSLVEPIWNGGASPFYTGGILAHGSITNCAMGAFDDRIYLSFPTAEANNRTLVYDPRFEWWSLLSLPCSCLATFRIGNAEELVFGYASGSNHIGRHSSAFTNDDGAAIESHWRSGWADQGNADVKKIRGSKVWGTGVVSYGLDADFSVLTGATELLDMTGSSGSAFAGGGFFEGEGYFEDFATALVGKECREPARGTTFSMYFSNSTLDQSWSVHRVEHLIPKVRDPAHGTS
jgi:hypothetical protein